MKYMLVLGLALLSGFAVAADKPPADHKTQLAVQLLQTMDFDHMMKNMSSQFTNMFDGKFASLAKCEEAKPIATDFSKELSGKIFSTLSSEGFKVDAAVLYANEFSEDELRELIAFYSSPLGKKMLAHMPELMKKSIEMSQARINDIMPDVQEISGRYAKKMADACKAPAASGQ